MVWEYDETTSGKGFASTVDIRLVLAGSLMALTFVLPWLTVREGRSAAESSTVVMAWSLLDSPPNAGPSDLALAATVPLIGLWLIGPTSVLVGILSCRKTDAPAPLLLGLGGLAMLGLLAACQNVPQFQTARQAVSALLGFAAVLLGLGLVCVMSHVRLRQPMSEGGLAFQAVTAGLLGVAAAYALALPLGPPSPAVRSETNSLPVVSWLCQSALVLAMVLVLVSVPLAKRRKDAPVLTLSLILTYLACVVPVLAVLLYSDAMKFDGINAKPALANLALLLACSLYLVGAGLVQMICDEASKAGAADEPAC